MSNRRESITGYFLDIQNELLYQSRQFDCSVEPVDGSEPLIAINIGDDKWGFPHSLRNYDFRDIDTGTPLYPIDIYTFRFAYGRWYRVVQGVTIQGYICYTTSMANPINLQMEVAHISSEYYNKQINLLSRARQKQAQEIEEAKLTRAWQN